MIEPALFLRLVIDPSCLALTDIAQRQMGTDEARVLLLAIALQESGLEHRRQVDANGMPIDDLARGWWQFEAGGGVHGVMTHPASAYYANTLCNALYVPWQEDDIHECIAWNSYVAAGFARLLLWTDPAPLPPVGDQQGAYSYYLRCWRPGKPYPQSWPANYAIALAAVLGPIKPPVGGLA